MSKFSTHLSLGQKAFGVQSRNYDGDYYVTPLTVGQIRVTETAPSSRGAYDTDPLFLEQYMCVETGVGSGTVWQYGKNIFASETDAEAGVVFYQQRAYKQRAERDARVAEQRAQAEERDRRELARLKEKYGDAVTGGV